MRNTGSGLAGLRAVVMMAAAAAAAAAMPAAMLAATAAPAGRAPKKLRDVVGPATNWPSGKVHKRRSQYPDGQRPKFTKERKRRQHTHLLRDEHGAVTLVGRDPLRRIDPATGQEVRRKWLAGISAQRGF